MQVKVHDKSTYWLNITDSNYAIDYSCTCGSVSFFYENCPHIVAALMHLRDNFEMLLEEEANREERARYMLAQVSPKQITDFLVKQMLDEPSTIGMFASEFGLCNVHLPRDYACKIDRMYASV